MQQQCRLGTWYDHYDLYTNLCTYCISYTYIVYRKYNLFHPVQYKSKIHLPVCNKP